MSKTMKGGPRAITLIVLICGIILRVCSIPLSIPDTANECRRMRRRESRGTTTCEKGRVWEWSYEWDTNDVARSTAKDRFTNGVLASLWFHISNRISSNSLKIHISLPSLPQLQTLTPNPIPTNPRNNSQNPLLPLPTIIPQFQNTSEIKQHSLIPSKNNHLLVVAAFEEGFQDLDCLVECEMIRENREGKAYLSGKPIVKLRYREIVEG